MSQKLDSGRTYRVDVGVHVPVDIALRLDSKVANNGNTVTAAKVRVAGTVVLVVVAVSVVASSESSASKGENGRDGKSDFGHFSRKWSWKKFVKECREEKF